MEVSIKLKQPKILKLAFLTAMCERFGFIMLSFLLVLYVKFLYGYTDTQAFTLFGVFTALAFIIPAIGGYLADHVFGIRRCITLGLTMEAIGICLLAMPSKTLVPIALALTVIGEGFFKTGPTDLMARTYRKDDPRIDSGFTIYYMGINIGGFFSPIIGGISVHYFGWHITFLIAGVVLFIGLIVYFFCRRMAHEVDTEVGRKELSYRKRFFWLLGLVAGFGICVFLISHVSVSKVFFILAGVLVLGYFAYEMFRGPANERQRILVCVILILMGFVFYIFYFQFFTSINLFINRSVQRHIFGFFVPPLTFLSLDPVWIVILSPILAWVSKKLAAQKRDLAVTTKFPLGVCITSLCFFYMSFSTNFYGPTGEVSFLWLVGAVFLFALGELFVGALGVAMVTRIAPKRLYGVMMGGWFLLGMGLGGVVSGMTATLASVPAGVTDPMIVLHIYHKAFLTMGEMGLGAGLLCFLLSPYLKRIAQLE